jgi:hypothetical protein
MRELVKSSVVFDEVNHTYKLGDRELSGITSLLERQGLAPSYDRVSKRVLDSAADYGTGVHAMIEMCDTLGDFDNDDPVYKAYRECMKKAGLVRLANEYLVSDEESYASSIDLVTTDYSLIDHKTTSTLHTETVSWQLSIYAYLFEFQNPTKKAGKLYVMWLPKGKPAKLVEVPRHTSEECEELLEADKRGEIYKPQLPISDNNTLALKRDAILEVYNIESQLKELKKKSATLRAGLLEMMQEQGIDKCDLGEFTLTVKKAYEKNDFDKEALKADEPEIYAKYETKKTVGDSLTLTLKK